MTAIFSHYVTMLLEVSTIERLLVALLIQDRNGLERRPYICDAALYALKRTAVSLELSDSLSFSSTS